MLDKVAPAAGAMAVGVQRGDALLVRLFHDGSLRPEDCVLRYAFTDGRVGSVTPSASSVKALDPIEALLRGHGRGKGMLAQHFDFAYSPRAGKLVRGGAVKVKIGDRFETAPWVKGFSFAHRIPRSATEFQDNLTFRRRRHADEPTVYGASCDVLRAYLGTPEGQALTPYLVNAFVIATYKAVAIDAKQHDALELLPQIEALIDTMEPSTSMRVDREIARMSVHTALWHYAAYKGDKALFNASMQGIEAVSRMDREQHPTFAFNASKSLILYGLITSFDDPKRALSLFDLAYERFRAAAAIQTSNPTWLKELSVSLDASILALESSRMLKIGEPLTRGNVRAILALAPRVDTPVFNKRLKRMVSEHRHGGLAEPMPGAGDDFDSDED